ncbi:nuclear transport factor 2 family protein [Kribbella qitaiheensis]|uniref:Nuclear transport factor 2 family protein n=1 Tax=Kribbella qitaiheensis TaxID=1544730 RepID=A0A7G6WRN5_9ACTN|nr:nuclear transport factor 2 family protein [Kribbella qitaiheensis]QNE16650.1 nuclear transport factor 2 family protein [Kribbella qitaiheensis]
MDRVAAHVEAFNAAVTTGDWTTFAARFARDARMTFPGLPIGPYDGRAAIAQAYRDNPPTETMTVIGSGDDQTIRFRWASGSTGAMQLRWTPDGQVAGLAITFD